MNIKMSNLVGFYSENIGRLFSLIIDEQSIKEVFVDELIMLNWYKKSILLVFTKLMDGVQLMKSRKTRELS